MKDVFTVDDDIAVALAGLHDDVLDALRTRSGCGIFLRGNEITLDGDAHSVQRAKELIDHLSGIARSGQQLTPDMVGVIDTASDVEAPDSQELGDVVLSHRGRNIGPKTVNQKRYVDAIRENTITFGVGPAGTGKTYLAMAMAAHSLVENRVQRIVLTRPAVEAGERLGFLPGTLEEKVDPYLRPLFDALYDMIDPDVLARHVENGVIEVVPLAFMRGRTLNDAFVILDEAQNTTPEQIKMFLTRLGFGSTMVVTGDVTQIDLPRGADSGLVVIPHILGDLDDISFIRFDQTDVVRHRLVQRIVAAYNAYASRGDTAGGTQHGG